MDEELHGKVDSSKEVKTLTTPFGDFQFMLCSANYELKKDDETIIEPEGSAYLYDNEKKDWYSFDGAIISEFPPD